MFAASAPRGGYKVDHTTLFGLLTRLTGAQHLSQSSMSDGQICKIPLTLDPCRASATNYQEVQEKVALETSQCEKVALRSATAITEMVKIMCLILSKKGANGASLFAVHLDASSQGTVCVLDGSLLIVQLVDLFDSTWSQKDARK